MKLSLAVRRFRMRGVFWRHYLAWAVRNVSWLWEPSAIVVNTLFFYLVWFPGRRAVARNLEAIFPESSRLRNTLRAFRVFWSFAWTHTDTMHFSERQMKVDWEFEGLEHLRSLASSQGAIILTAHMGNYDLGSYLFTEHLGKRLTVVRLPEVDPESDQFSRSKREGKGRPGYRVDYNLDPAGLAVSLVEALREGDVVAIQGDRSFPGIPSVEVELFGRKTHLPTGPFALAMATGAPIYPLFVVRSGRRRYRVITLEPFFCERGREDRDLRLRRTVEQWRSTLEPIIRRYWHQWHTFEPFTRDPAS